VVQKSARHRPAGQYKFFAPGACAAINANQRSTSRAPLHAKSLIAGHQIEPFIPHRQFFQSVEISTEIIIVDPLDSSPPRPADRPGSILRAAHLSVRA